MKAYIDKRKCPADNRLCKPLTECPTEAISWIEDEDEPLGSRMELTRKNVSVVVFASLFAAGIA